MRTRWMGDSQFRVRNEYRAAKVRMQFKREDCWVGVFWRKEMLVLHIWICILPMLPLYIQIPVSYEAIDDPTL